MASAPPKPGEVIHYSYLWWSEARKGQEEGRKDRPCAVAVTHKREAGSTRVIVLPITHTPPREGEDGVEIPPLTKHRLGLDDERSWIITSELNVFTWPGYDIRRRPSGAMSYGLLPEKLIRRVFDQMRNRARDRRPKQVERDG